MIDYLICIFVRYNKLHGFPQQLTKGPSSSCAQTQMFAADWYNSDIFFSFRIYFLCDTSDNKILIKACKTNLTSQLHTCLYIEFKNYYFIFYFNSLDNFFCIIQRVIMGHFNVGLKAVNFNFLFLLIFIPARSKYNLFFCKTCSIEQLLRYLFR